MKPAAVLFSIGMILGIPQPLPRGISEFKEGPFRIAIHGGQGLLNSQGNLNPRMTPWILSLSSGYLLGSIPFGYLLVRFFRKEDIRTQGSGNIGATNVIRSGAKGLGIATLLLDLGKAYTAVLLALQWFGRGDAHRYDLAAGAGVAAVLGHVFPVWLGFRGGKGVASALGVLLALSPLAGLYSFLVFLVVVLLTRYVSLASIIGAASFPFFGLSLVKPLTPLLAFALISIPVLVIAKHHQNIARLLHGTENRFGSRPKPGKASL